MSDGAPDPRLELDAESQGLAHLLDAIFRCYHYDFRCYSEASLRRRLRAALTRFGCASLPELEARALADPAMFGELLRFLTVQVSDLFRDPQYFRAIREAVVPYLGTYAQLRLWVAGCATGEEAYSLAIVLLEEGLLDRALIYATDINPHCLRTAEAGVYDTERFAKFSESYRLAGGKASLSDYYTAAYGGAVLDRRLRKSIVFTDHSLATDSSFAEVQLVSCRNVLIYFERDLQERALGLMYDSLCHRGFLGLGLKETLRFTRQATAFTELVPETRIYQRIG